MVPSVGRWAEQTFQGRGRVRDLRPPRASFRVDWGHFLSATSSSRPTRRSLRGVPALGSEESPDTRVSQLCFISAFHSCGCEEGEIPALSEEEEEEEETESQKLESVDKSSGVALGGPGVGGRAEGAPKGARGRLSGSTSYLSEADGHLAGRVGVSM